MPVDVSVLQALAATTALDNFDYTENPISNGGKWTVPVLSGESNLQTNGSAAIVQSGDADSTGYRNDQNFGPDFSAMITVTTKVSTDNGLVGIHMLLQGAGLGAGTPNGYRGEVRIRTTGDEWRIQRIDAGALTVLSSGTIQEISAGDSIAVVRSGNNIELWWLTGSTWTFIVSASDATYTAAGKIGVHITDLSTNDSREDNLKAQNTAAASTVLGAPSPPVIRVRLRAY